MIKNIIGLTLGFIISFGAVTFTQTIQHFQASVDNAYCWDQAAGSLAEARAMKVEITFDTLAPAIQDPICNLLGSTNTSPYECGIQIPLVIQTVGTHVLKYRMGNVEFDGTISWAPLTNTSFIIDPVFKGNPAAPANGHFIKKKLLLLIAFLIGTIQPII